MLLTRPISAVHDATPRARIVHIDLHGTPFPFEPGQAIWLGTHGQEVRRPYSIAVSPDDVKRDGRLELLVGIDTAGDAGPHLRLEAGALVDLDGPFGGFTFPGHPSERRFLFIAGGTGIAPLRSMIRYALGLPHDAVGVMYSARSPEEFAYASELQALADAGTIELRMTVTRGVSGNWSGTRGRIARADLQPLVHDGRTLCFVCGPPALVEEMPRLLEELGVARQCVRTEEWSEAQR
ncbi:MAG: FAD-binding oxidoreductase [Vicinamibacterales bacterium]